MTDDILKPELKKEYKYFTLHEMATGFNIYKNNLFLGYIEKYKRKYVFTPMQDAEWALIWYEDCLGDVIKVLKHLNTYGR